MSVLSADQAFHKLLTMKFHTMLDVGSGTGEHAELFRKVGKQVTTIALSDADIVGDFNKIKLGKFDCLWVSHVLEHQRNVGSFLERCFDCLYEDGILAITVPPLKHEIVGGHLTLWNAGLLLYNLILAGFDCRNAAVKEYGYNISVIVRKQRAVLPTLKMDYGDIESLKDFFPFPAQHGFDGRVQEVNW